MHEVHSGGVGWVAESSLIRISALGADGGTLGLLFDVLGRVALHFWFTRPG